MKRVSWMVMLVVIALIAAACGGQAATTGDANSSASGGSPADTVKSFITAVFTGEGDISSFVCSSMDEAQRTAMLSAMNSMADSLKQANATVDLSGLTFTVQDETAESATVVVGGSMKVTMAGTTQDSPMGDATFPVRNENGWKLCQ
ncbi:MAG TPA: hypothetical protein PLQ56_21820 [Aggregatilineales bacterium]|nr:hypothetical protein [Anaerolineae bacterium]HUN09261.1 hypothetical protein [Aggregatilineales bacterium]